MCYLPAFSHACLRYGIYPHACARPAIGAAIQQGMGLQPVNSASDSSRDASHHAALTHEIKQSTKWSSSTESSKQRSRKAAVTQPTITSAPAIIPPKQVSGSTPSLITTIIHNGKAFEVRNISGHMIVLFTLNGLRDR